MTHPRSQSSLVQTHNDRGYGEPYLSLYHNKGAVSAVAEPASGGLGADGWPS